MQERDTVTSGAGGVTRKVLQQVAQGPNQELILVEVIYPPGGVAPVHRHPVDGLVYIVEGVAESAYGNDQPRLYRAGETLQDHAAVPHTVFRNADPNRPLRFLVFYLASPGQPYVVDASDGPP